MDIFEKLRKLKEAQADGQKTSAPAATPKPASDIMARIAGKRAGNPVPTAEAVAPELPAETGRVGNGPAGQLTRPVSGMRTVRAATPAGSSGGHRVLTDESKVSFTDADFDDDDDDDDDDEDEAEDSGIGALTAMLAQQLSSGDLDEPESTPSPTVPRPAPEPEPKPVPEPKPADVAEPVEKPALVRQPLLRRPGAPAQVVAPKAPAPTYAPAQPAQPAASIASIAGADSKPGGLTLPKGSLLAGLRAGADVRAARSVVTPGAQACIDGGEAVYSPEQFIEDWPKEPSEDDWHPDAGAEYIGNCAEVIRKGCARLNQIFATHLAGLAVERAPEPVIREIGQIVKLTFGRVKETPGAYEMLDLTDRATIIKGLRAMTAKRHASAVARASRDATSYSAALEAMENSSEDLKGLLGGITMDFDVGSL